MFKQFLILISELKKSFDIHFSICPKYPTSTNKDIVIAVGLGLNTKLNKSAQADTIYGRSKTPRTFHRVNSGL